MRTIVLAIVLNALAITLVACSGTTPLLVATHYDDRVEQMPIGKIIGADASARFVGSSVPEQQFEVESAMRVFRAVVTSVSFKQMNTSVTQVIVDSRLHAITMRLRNCEYLVLSEIATSPSKLQANEVLSTSEGSFPIRERGVWQPCRS